LTLDALEAALKKMHPLNWTLIIPEWGMLRVRDLLDLIAELRASRKVVESARYVVARTDEIEPYDGTVPNVEDLRADLAALDAPSQ